MLQTLYHTIQKRHNVRASVKNAPYLCIDEPWFGNGYYFWDGSEELAKWWGETHCHGNYIITKTDINFADGTLLDLIDNMEHFDFFNTMAEIAYQRLGEVPTVPKIIEEIRRRKNSPFIAVRGMGLPYNVSPYNRNDIYSRRFKFAPNVRYYLDTFPKHQICIFDKKNIPPLTMVRQS